MLVKKYIIWPLLLVVLWIPFAEKTFRLFTPEPLKGAFTVHAKPVLSDSTWLEGSYQRNYEMYLNDTIGFHQNLIRLRNQFDYSLFSKCHSYDIEMGKNGYLVATSNLDYSLGKKFTEPALIDSTVNMLADLNDTLTKLNKTLLIMLAPNKGFYHRDVAPMWYSTRQEHESDYQRYARLLAEKKIKTIDFNKWFVQMKPTTPYVLFPKCGVHWSTYGSVLAGDSMIRFIEHDRHIDLPDLMIRKIDTSIIARSSDADLNTTLNLIWQIPNGVMGYPVFTFNKERKTKLKALFISDSFFYNLMFDEIPHNAFEEFSFWYYNYTIHSNGPNDGKFVGNISVPLEIEKHDVISYLATENTVGNLGWGSISYLWELYFWDRNLSPELKIIVQRIRDDKAWYQSVVEKAPKNNLSVTQQLIADARWAYSVEKNKK